DRGGVAPGCLSEHHVGSIDAADVPGGANSATKLRDADARTETDLEDAVGGPHIEQGSDPAVALAVGGAIRHHPAGHVPGRALGVPELPDDGRDDGALHVHGVLPTTKHGWRRIVAVSRQRVRRRARRTGASLLVDGRVSVFMLTPCNFK